jgi:hypothetical protein
MGWRELIVTGLIGIEIFRFDTDRVINGFEVG